MKNLVITFYALFIVTQVMASVSIKELRVYKKERKLELVTRDNDIYKTYKIMLGQNPEGAKSQDGDNKTPEGAYELDLKNPSSKFHKAFHISYPSARDSFKARIHGHNPGGDIMLHGLPNSFEEMQEWLVNVNLDNQDEDFIRMSLVNLDWTNGCISVTDEDIDEIYSLVEVPTKIIINP
jgi:murein L,D-transpeptidase YafK